MQTTFDQDITFALGETLNATSTVTVTGDAELPSCFAVTDLAVATIKAASVELAAVKHRHQVALHRRRAALWFDMTLRPEGWTLPSAWDPIAGVYRCKTGWIRLHTNAPHHRDAALRVLMCRPEKEAVATSVEDWDKTSLETEIVAEGGAAAAMLSLV